MRAMAASSSNSAFEDLQAFASEANSMFDQMEETRRHMLSVLKKKLIEDGHEIEGCKPEDEPSEELIEEELKTETEDEHVLEEKAEEVEDEKLGKGNKLGKGMGKDYIKSEELDWYHTENREQEPQVQESKGKGKVKVQESSGLGNPRAWKRGPAPMSLTDMGPEFVNIALKMVICPEDIDWNDPDVIWVEQTITLHFQPKKMRDRGPRGPEDGGPATWRGQPYRKNSKRWGTRGGWRERARREAMGKGSTSGGKVKGGNHEGKDKGGKGRAPPPPPPPPPPPARARTRPPSTAAPSTPPEVLAPPMRRQRRDC